MAYAHKMARTGGPSSVAYGLGVIGALIYYVHFHSGTFWLVVLALLKAVVWPALLVYQLMLFLHM
jgi:hypothetical protein